MVISIRSTKIFKNDYDLVNCSDWSSWWHLKGETKNPIKIDGGNHHTKDRRESQIKAKRCTAHKNQRREKINPSRGRKLSHPHPL
jgi:hypothetical protein